MGDKNSRGNGSETEIARRPFKKGEKERHFEMFTKNSLLARKHKALTKKYETAAETCLEDIEAGGYAQEAQGELDVDTEPDEARV